MTVAAALAIGVCCALVAGSAFGAVPELGRLRALRPPRAATTTAWLQQAGVPLSPARFWCASAAGGLLAMLVLAAVTGSLFVALVPSAAVAGLPRAYFARRRRRRLREVQLAWPDGLRDIAASIASGRSLTQAVVQLANHGPVPLRGAFARFPDLARVLGFAAAIEIIKEDIADPTTDRVLEVLLVANERGGAVVRAILEDLASATARDLKLLDELDTEALEMRINARAVVVLPWLVLVALTARPGPFRAFYRSGSGVATLAVAAVLTLVGVAVLSRLGRERDEPRVFARPEARA